MLTEITTRGRHTSQTVLDTFILSGCDAGRFPEKKMRGQQLADGSRSTPCLDLHLNQPAHRRFRVHVVQASQKLWAFQDASSQ